MKNSALLLLFATGSFFATLASAHVTLICAVSYETADDNYTRPQDAKVTFCTGREAEQSIGYTDLDPQHGYALVYFADGTVACIKLRYDEQFDSTQPFDHNDLAQMFERFTQQGGWEVDGKRLFWTVQAKIPNGHWYDPDYDP